MNYQAHYDRLIQRARNRVLDGYVERHHVLPKCMGGSDAADNLVQLTAAEHFVAHQLLCKLHPGVKGLTFAVVVMCGDPYGARSNKLYAWLRARAAIAMSESQNLQQQLMKESQQFQQQQGQSYDQVAQTLQQQQMMQQQMLMQQQMQQQQAMMAQQQMPPQMDPNLAPQAQQQPGGFGAKPPVGQLPPQQSQQSQPLQQPQGGLPQAESAPEQKQGILGKAMAKMDALVQKLASYFEEKLPSHVISEVKEIGQTMAKAGMKEAAIPTGPEPQRGVDTPGKGQSQGKQLG